MTSADDDRGLEDGAALAPRDAFVLVRELRAENERLRAENERLRDADAVLTRWGRLRAEYAALLGRPGHTPTHEESVAASARMEALEAEIADAFWAVARASEARAARSNDDKPRLGEAEGGNGRA